jgi:hypothetical protein
MSYPSSPLCIGIGLLALAVFIFLVIVITKKYELKKAIRLVAGLIAISVLLTVVVLDIYSVNQYYKWFNDTKSDVMKKYPGVYKMVLEDNSAHYIHIKCSTTSIDDKDIEVIFDKIRKNLYARQRDTDNDWNGFGSMGPFFYIEFDTNDDDEFDICYSAEYMNSLASDTETEDLKRWHKSSD